MAFNFKKTETPTAREVSRLDINDLIGNNENVVLDTTKVQEIDIDLLVPYSGQDGSPQPFRMYSSDEMKDLEQSIKNNGVIQPIIIRPINNGKYQILAGHNRAQASKNIGNQTIRAIIADGVTEEQATLIMLDTNICQRKKMSTKEKVKAYLLQKQTLLNLGYDNSTAIISECYGESKKNVQRYLNMGNLNSELLDMADNNTFDNKAAVQLSYLNEANQKNVLEYIQKQDSKVKLTEDKGQILRQLAEQHELTEADIDGVLNPPVVKQKEQIVKLKYDETVKTLTDGIPFNAISDLLMDLLQEHDKVEHWAELNGYELKGTEIDVNSNDNCADDFEDQSEFDDFV